MPARELRNGAELAYHNGVALLDEAKLLADIDSFGHATALTMFAVEELSKAQIYVQWAEGVRQISNFQKLLENGKASRVRPDVAVLSHRTKYAQFLAYLILSEVVNAKHGFKYAFERELVVYNYHEHAQARLFDKRRQDALYVDYASGEWKSPKEFEPVVFVYMHSRARQYSKWVKRMLDDGYASTVQPLVQSLTPAPGARKKKRKQAGHPQ